MWICCCIWQKGGFVMRGFFIRSECGHIEDIYKNSWTLKMLCILRYLAGYININQAYIRRYRKLTQNNLWRLSTSRVETFSCLFIYIERTKLVCCCDLSPLSSAADTSSHPLMLAEHFYGTAVTFIVKFRNKFRHHILAPSSVWARNRK